MYCNISKFISLFRTQLVGAAKIDQSDCASQSSNNWERTSSANILPSSNGSQNLRSLHRLPQTYNSINIAEEDSLHVSTLFWTVFFFFQLSSQIVSFWKYDIFTFYVFMHLQFGKTTINCQSKCPILNYFFLFPTFISNNFIQ